MNPCQQTLILQQAALGSLDVFYIIQRPQMGPTGKSGWMDVASRLCWIQGVQSVLCNHLSYVGGYLRRRSSQSLVCTETHGICPQHRVVLAAEPSSWRLEVGVIRELPVPLLLGTDCPELDQQFAPSTAASTRSKGRQLKPRPSLLPALLAAESEREGESGVPLTFSMSCFNR